MALQDFLNDVEGTLNQYERIFGRGTRRVRTMIDRHGAVGALIRLMQTEEPSADFHLLRDRGRLDLTFETLIVRYADEFPSQGS